MLTSNIIKIYYKEPLSKIVFKKRKYQQVHKMQYCAIILCFKLSPWLLSACLACKYL